jgi:hypothetical protein
MLQSIESVNIESTHVCDRSGVGKVNPILWAKEGKSHLSAFSFGWIQEDMGQLCKLHSKAFTKLSSFRVDAKSLPWLISNNESSIEKRITRDGGANLEMTSQVLKTFQAALDGCVVKKIPPGILDNGHILI